MRPTTNFFVAIFLMLFASSAFSQLSGIWQKIDSIKLDHHTISVESFHAFDSDNVILVINDPLQQPEPLPGYILRSTDGGLSWQKNLITALVNPSSFFVTPPAMDTFFFTNFGVGKNDSSLITTSYDGGLAWKSINSDTNKLTNLVMWDATSGIRTWLDTAAKRGHAEYTEDGGKTFTKKVTDPVFLYYYDSLYKAYSTATSLYINRISNTHAVAVISNSALQDPLPMLYTSDAGISWHESSHPDTLPKFNSFISINKGAAYITARESGQVRPYYFYSVDTGRTWRKSNSFTTKLRSVAPFGTSGVCATPDGGNSTLIYTTNEGQSWTSDSSSFKDYMIGGFRFTGATSGISYATNPNALPPGDSTIHIFRYINTKNSVSQDDVVQSKKNISYPNPASSNIHLIVEDVDNVRFSGKVYDALGKEFIISYNHEHTGIFLDISNLPTGSYTCSLIRDNTIYSHSFIVSR